MYAKIISKFHISVFGTERLVGIISIHKQYNLHRQPTMYGLFLNLSTPCNGMECWESRPSSVLQACLRSLKIVGFSCRQEAATICSRLACDLDLWPFDLKSGVRVMCDVGYLCANFSLPRTLCSRLRLDVRDRRQTDRRQTASSLNAPLAGA